MLLCVNISCAVLYLPFVCSLSLLLSCLVCVLLLVLCFVVLCIEQESTRSCTEYVDNVLSAFAMLYLVGNGIRHRFSLYMAAFDTCTRGRMARGYGNMRNNEKRLRMPVCGVSVCGLR